MPPPRGARLRPRARARGRRVPRCKCPMHPHRRTPQVRMRILGKPNPPQSRNSPMPARLATLLVLLGRPAAVLAGTTFTAKSALQSALNSWCSNPSSAAATHGAIATWDTSAVTDFSYLIKGVSCTSTFNEVRDNRTRPASPPPPRCCPADRGRHCAQAIGAWNVGSVTNMRARRRPPPVCVICRPVASAPVAAMPRVARRAGVVARHAVAAPRVSVATRARRARRKCLMARPPSTRRWARGTSAK